MAETEKPAGSASSPSSAPGAASTGLQSPADRGARPADDQAKVAEQPRVGGIPENQTVTPPTDAPYVGGKQVAVLIGPYRGNVLTMPEADATQAINDHWAAAHPTGPFDPNAERHDPLTDEEQRAAYDAAMAWASNVGKPPEPPDPPDPPPEGGAKSLGSGQAGSYETRTAAAPAPAKTTTTKTTK